MAFSRNTRSFTDAFAGIETTLKELFVEKPKLYFADIRAKLRDLPGTNFALGCKFADEGKWRDAAWRFKMALYFQPNFPAAQYNLGCSLVQLGQRAKARQAFINALKLQPNYADALFMLSALDPASVPPSQRPQRMPGSVVVQFFDRLAPQYDAMEANNQYQGGRLAYDALKPLIASPQNLTVVDLGCGTGLASRPWRPLAKEITGVDFSAPMADAARLMKVGDAPLFDRVLQEDIYAIDTSAAPLAEADVVLVVNTAHFLGNLEPLLVSLSKKLKPGALVAMTYESFAAAGGYGVNLESGRFGHAPDYVRQAAQTAGFTVKQEARVNLYPGYAAQLIVLGK